MQKYQIVVKARRLVTLHATQGDVLCLQEVDEKMFTEHLLPHLQREGGPQGCFLFISLVVDGTINRRPVFDPS